MSVLRLLLLFLALMAMPAKAASTTSQVQTAWRLLDYVAVDYPEAVRDGKVTNEAEYAEMQEFSATVDRNLRGLPAEQALPSILKQSSALQKAVGAKAPPEQIEDLARDLGALLLRTYPVPLAPATAPDLAKGSVLYKEHCASCHGASGDGKGPLAARLDPQPIDFTDRKRAMERSVFALEQVINQGLDGTAMQSFSELPSSDRWALAFHVSRLALPEAAAGERIWRRDPATRQWVPDLAALAGLTPSVLGKEIGPAKANAVLAYLRAHPDAVVAPRPQSLALARKRLGESLNAYQAGEADKSADLALSAYLDGFEPVEAVLASRDSALMGRIEAEMGKLRSAIGERRPVAAVAQQVGIVDALFTDAEDVLRPNAGTGASAFIGAFTILLREGLEALLIVVAMIAFLRKAERTEMVRHVHAGWIAAILSGALTWAIATAFINISGASRELTEGYGSLFAAIVLLTVGIWMHGKSQAGEWQRYIRKTLDRALSRRSAWFLFGLAFLVVYREVFETILFYAALTAQGDGSAVLAGALTAVMLLCGLAWVMLRYSARLPVSEFFRYSSALVAILAVVLAGKGVAALQEAGAIGFSPLAGVPRITAIGLFPSWQSVLAQLIALATVVVGIWYNQDRQRRSQAVRPSGA